MASKNNRPESAGSTQSEGKDIDIQQRLRQNPGMLTSIIQEAKVDPGLEEELEETREQRDLLQQQVEI